MAQDPLATRLVRPAVDHPWWTVAIIVLLVLFAGSGGRFLSFTGDYRVFFGPDNPQLQAFEAMEAEYTKSGDNILLVLAPQDGNIFTPGHLAAVEEATEQAWQIPHSIRVDSLSNFQHTYAEDDDLIVEDLVSGARDLDPEAIERIRQVALNEPLLLDRLVPASGAVTAINVSLQFAPEVQHIAVPEAAAEAREIARRIEAEHPDIDVHLTGMAMLNAAFSASAEGDTMTLVPLSFAVVLLGLAVLLRGLGPTFGTLLVILFSIMTAMGAAGWMGITLTPPTVSAPTVILTLAVADSVHVLVSYQHELGRGADKRSAMLEAVRLNFQPVVLTSLTTAIGFLTMNFSDSPPFRDLGNVVAVGVCAAMVLSLVFLPAVMMLLPARARAAAGDTGGAMERLGELVVAQRTPLLYGMGAVIIVLAACVAKNDLNDVFVEYFDESVPFRQATDFFEDRLGGIVSIDYDLGSGEPGGVSDPEFLRQVDAFASWFREQPETINVQSITDTIKRLSKNMHGDDPAFYALPDDRELTAQFLLLYELSLPYGLDLNNQINIDKSATKLTVNLEVLSVNEMLALEERAQDWLAENAPAIEPAEGTGTNIMFAHIGRRNIESMLGGAIVALVLISVILVFALRSVKIGAVSLVPNLAPAAMAFGVWGLLVGEVGLSLSVVASMTMGIVVDDTIHFLSKYLRAQREKGLDSQAAVRYAFRSVGSALCITSAVLACGFLVLTASDFNINADMGLLTAVTIVLALVADFLFLPPLLMKLGEKHDAKVATDRPSAQPAAP